MKQRPITFDVKHNDEKTEFWYDLVAGNGNTVMRSTKTDYANADSARRAARRLADLINDGPGAIVQFVGQGGQVVRELPALKPRLFQG